MGSVKDATQRTVAVDGDRILEIWDRQVGTAATSEAVHATLREAIVYGFLPPKAHLGEEELGALLGVSRTPIREALLRLEAEHLAVRILRGGLVVRQISPDEIREVYEVRQQLSAFAVQLAVPRVSAAELAKLQWLSDQLREALASGDIPRCVALGDDFHDCLYRASGNSVLVQLLLRLRDRVRRFPGITYQDARRAERIIEEHNQLINALSAGDAEAAAQLARDHQREAMLARISMLDASGGDRSDRQDEWPE